ncbi:type II toxin-antitoxin system PrlF family antitoxin [Fulvimarina sp. MAC8]|uniref:type II toxin-antitoxin system PrlF family antitoxin n=1 Tax=Fulvimarina sp. MAC8 TaxID=3162874 RepID=UPI0032EC22E5
MSAAHDAVSTLTERYQTTVPRAVRKQLQLGKGDKIRYRTSSDGRVYIEPVYSEELDPALGPFLDLLENDIRSHPEHLKVFGGNLHRRIEALVGDIEVDLDEAISPDDE